MHQIQQKSWLSALASAIKALCALFINASAVLNDGVAMAETTVSAARERQVIDIAISLETYEQEAVKVAALGSMKTQVEIDAFLGSDPAKQQAYATEYAQLNSKVSAALNKLRAERAARNA